MPTRCHGNIMEVFWGRRCHGNTLGPWMSWHIIWLGMSWNSSGTKDVIEILWDPGLSWKYSGTTVLSSYLLYRHSQIFLSSLSSFANPHNPCGSTCSPGCGGPHILKSLCVVRGRPLHSILASLRHFSIFFLRL